MGVPLDEDLVKVEEDESYKEVCQKFEFKGKKTEESQKQDKENRSKSKENIKANWFKLIWSIYYIVLDFQYQIIRCSSIDQFLLKNQK